MALELDNTIIETTQLQIAVVKIARGLRKNININRKPYTFICPKFQNIKKGDWIVVEVTRKTRKKNKSHDFKIGRVEELMTWSDKEILSFRPNSFIICKVEDSEDFENRCKNIYDKKRSLWARYNAVDKRNNRYIEGVPMNIFDKILDNNGRLHFNKLNQYTHKMKKGKSTKMK